MKKEKNVSPDTKKAMEEAKNFSKKTQLEIDEKAKKSKKTWLDAASHLLGGIDKGSKGY